MPQLYHKTPPWQGFELKLQGIVNDVRTKIVATEGVLMPDLSAQTKTAQIY
jgi:hypothetical protein